jgi:hypothetical protein
MKLKSEANDAHNSESTKNQQADDSKGKERNKKQALDPAGEIGW